MDVRRLENDGNIFVGLPDLFTNSIAIHSGYLNVKQDKIQIICFIEYAERLLSIGGMQDFQSPVPETDPYELKTKPVVLHDKNFFPRPGYFCQF